MGLPSGEDLEEAALASHMLWNLERVYLNVASKPQAKNGGHALSSKDVIGYEN